MRLILANGAAREVQSTTTTIRVPRYAQFVRFRIAFSSSCSAEGATLFTAYAIGWWVGAGWGRVQAVGAAQTYENSAQIRAM